MKPCPLKLSFLAKFMTNLSLSNCTPFLVPSDLNPVPTEYSPQGRMTSIAVVGFIIRIQSWVVSPEQGELTYAQAMGHLARGLQTQRHSDLQNYD